MDITIMPRPLRGEITAIPSKSQAHRMLICAALADSKTSLCCSETNQDIEATADCLRALGADIQRTNWGYSIVPIRNIPANATLNCRESGSTLRFLLPIVGALGVHATFVLNGRLPQRPLSPLWEEMERMGCTLSRPTSNTICCQGKLLPGQYTIAGNVSSQFISGLLFALPLIRGKCDLEITGKTESRPYIEMTRKALALFDAPFFHSPGVVAVEGDWSNGAFFLAAQSLGNSVEVTGLSADSVQGDQAVVKLLQGMEECVSICAADIPDLIPILSVVAAAKHGAVFTNIQRLRLKESDRVDAIISMITALGGKAEQTASTLTVSSTGLTGGTVDSRNDHRIAMSAAIAATVCSNPVTIIGAECVNKSYPTFWDEYKKLGGQYEQYLR